MIYAQFYRRGVLTGNVIEACGDRAVIFLDGRCSKQWMAETAQEECQRRGYVAWRIFKGDRLDSASPISQLWYVHKNEQVRNPSWLSAHGM